MLGARSDRAWVDRVLQPESGERGELSAEGVASCVFTRQQLESVTRSDYQMLILKTSLISKNGCAARGWT